MPPPPASAPASTCPPTDALRQSTSSASSAARPRTRSSSATDAPVSLPSRSSSSRARPASTSPPRSAMASSPAPRCPTLLSLPCCPLPSPTRPLPRRLLLFWPTPTSRSPRPPTLCPAAVRPVRTCPRSCSRPRGQHRLCPRGAVRTRERASCTGKRDCFQGPHCASGRAASARGAAAADPPRPPSLVHRSLRRAFYDTFHRRVGLRFFGKLVVAPGHAHLASRQPGFARCHHGVGRILRFWGQCRIRIRICSAPTQPHHGP